MRPEKWQSISINPERSRNKRLIADIISNMQSDIEAFLAKGGVIKKIPYGKSGEKRNG